MAVAVQAVLGAQVVVVLPVLGALDVMVVALVVLVVATPVRKTVLGAVAGPVAVAIGPARREC